jgi:hypothetical protein
LVKHGNTGAQVHAHKLQRINPLAVSDLSLMFGQLGPNGDWLDGIFTSYWRKANKEHNVHRTTTWLCLDAPLHQGWAENLSSVLDNGKVRTSHYLWPGVAPKRNVFLAKHFADPLKSPKKFYPTLNINKKSTPGQKLHKRIPFIKLLAQFSAV